MTSERREHFGMADNHIFHPQLVTPTLADSGSCRYPAFPAPQIIPEWAVDHLGKKVHFIRPYFDGYRTWPAYQPATLDGFQVGEHGVECVVYFDDYDDHGYLSAPAELFMPIHERRSLSRTMAVAAHKPLAAKPRFHAFVLGLTIDLLSRAGLDAGTARRTIDEHFTFR